MVKSGMENMEIKEHPAKRAINLLITLLLIFAVMLCVYVVAQVMSRGYANIAGYSMFRVVTGSMEPTMSVGSLLLTKQVPIESVQVGDIVCFRAQESAIFGQMMTHRVVDIFTALDGSLLLETKGDANLVADGYFVNQSNFVGLVTWYTGDGSVLSSVFSFFTNKIGFLACIVIPCLLIASLILHNCVKNIRSAMNEAVEALEEEPDSALKITKEEYEEMYARIRAELLKELMPCDQNPEEK